MPKRNEKVSAQIGVIGGSGLYKMRNISDIREIKIKTPFGRPSDAVVLGTIGGTRCAFLPRHGRDHAILPSEINGRANIWALKSLGVERLIAFGAAGSLREDLAPYHFIFPDQLVDETKGRTSTFFGEGIVAHVTFDRPFCGAVSDVLYETAKSLHIHSHRGGTHVCMEGPTYSTQAESEMHRKLGYSVIGMTAVGEAKLAREAEMCYALVNMITDYDCWKAGEEVSTEKVLERLHANVANAQALVEAALPKLAKLPRNCRCSWALAGAIVTPPRAINRKAARRLKLLIERYVQL